MTLKKLKLINIVVIFLLSFLAHNLYEWVPNTFTSIFFPVNESIFEHMKIIATCFLFYGFFEFFLLQFLHISFSNYLFSLIVCIISGILFYLLLFLPIYFFTLIAAYKYGFRVGLLTAVLSPVINHVLFAMPSEAVLPIILIKSTLLAGASALAARTVKTVSLLAVLGVILSYQLIGTAFEWMIEGDFYIAVQDFRIGIPGMLIQWFGGYALLKAIAKL